MAMRQKQLNASINTSGTAKVPDNLPPQPPNKRTLYTRKQISKRNNQWVINKKAKRVSNQNLKFKFKETQL